MPSSTRRGVEHLERRPTAETALRRIRSSSGGGRRAGHAPRRTPSAMQRVRNGKSRAQSFTAKSSPIATAYSICATMPRNVLRSAQGLRKRRAGKGDRGLRAFATLRVRTLRLMPRPHRSSTRSPRTSRARPCRACHGSTPSGRRTRSNGARPHRTAPGATRRRASSAPLPRVFVEGCREVSVGDVEQRGGRRCIDQ